MWSDPGLWMTLATASLVGGATLLKRGIWPRRIGDAPHCHGCDYNLTGLVTNSCPECGRVLDAAAITLGERRRSAPVSLAGALLLCIPLTIAAAALRGVDPYPFCPTTLLVLRLDDPARCPQAWDELDRRTKTEGLSRSQLDRVARMCFSAVTATGAQNTQRMLDWLGRAYMSGQLNPADGARLESQLLRVALSVPADVNSGAAVPCSIHFLSTCPANMYVHFQTHCPRLDKKERCAVQMESAHNGPSIANLSFEGPKEPGKYHLELPVDLQLQDASGKVYLKRAEILTADFHVLSEKPHSGS